MNQTTHQAAASSSKQTEQSKLNNTPNNLSNAPSKLNNEPSKLSNAPGKLSKETCIAQFVAMRFKHQIM